jgi:hypothetical protein
LFAVVVLRCGIFSVRGIVSIPCAISIVKDPPKMLLTKINNQNRK